MIFDLLISISKAGPSGMALITRICAGLLEPELEPQLVVTRLKAATASARGRAFNKPDIFILENSPKAVWWGAGRFVNSCSVMRRASVEARYLVLNVAARRPMGAKRLARD